MWLWLKTNEWYGVGGLVACVLLFDRWERSRPARDVDRRVDLHLNLLAFLATVTFKHFFDGNLDVLVGRWTGVSTGGVFHAIDGWPFIVKILAGMVAMDFTLYWIHREQHRIPWLWRTHVWHHTIEHLYWLSMFRVSWFHLMLYTIPQTVLMTVLGYHTAEIATASILSILFNFWDHSNIAVDIGPLDRVFVTPAFHRIHHAADKRMRTNLGLIFTVWDRMFGTFTDPRLVTDRYPLGLPARAPASRTPRMIVGF